MNIQLLEKYCYFYRKMKLKKNEEQTIIKGLKEHPDWEWGIKRLEELTHSQPQSLNESSPNIEPIQEVIQSQLPESSLNTEPVIQTDLKSTIAEIKTENVLTNELKTKKDFIEQSFIYQKEWRFAKDKELIDQALSTFPDWKYAQQRLEWHSRPEFHKDPEHSRTQPRKILETIRNPEFIPTSETLNSLCFVTASGSDQPYFNLSIQLLESIKATRWYNTVPIKLIDCGLTEEDALYLKKRFGCEIKDPGWDIPDHIKFGGGRQNLLKDRPLGFKGLTARPFIHKHFPGYKYYFWIDTDSWIQDETIFDIFIKRCESQGLAISNEMDFLWTKTQATNTKIFVNSIPLHYINIMMNKKLLCNGFYCITQEYNEKYADYCDKALLEKNQYNWGFDMAMLNYFFYKEINGEIFNEWHYYYSRMSRIGSHVDKNKNILTINNKIVSVISLTWYLKKLPLRIFFSNELKETEKYWVTREISATTQLEKKSQEEAEQLAYEQCEKNQWTQGTLHYRIYLDPEDMYGKIEDLI